MGTLTVATTGTVSGLANNQQINAVTAALATMVQGGTPPTPASTGLLSVAGLWWHDTTNNQVKLRDQADTAWILVGTLDEANKLFAGAASGIAAIQGASKNVKIDTRSGSVVVTADELVLATSANTYGVVRAISLTVSPGASGANGLDTGLFAANTWYSVWVITNGTAVAGLLSASATAPTLPSGYTYKARVGWVRSNATPVLKPTLQFGRRAQYVVDGSVLTGLPQLTSGSTAAAWTAAAWGTFAPSTAGVIRCALSTGFDQNIEIGLAPNGNYGLPGTSTSNPAPIAWRIGSTNAAPVMAGDIVPESANLYYWSNSSGGHAWIIGWEDNL